MYHLKGAQRYEGVLGWFVLAEQFLMMSVDRKMGEERLRKNKQNN